MNCIKLDIKGRTKKWHKACGLDLRSSYILLYLFYLLDFCESGCLARSRQVMARDCLIPFFLFISELKQQKVKLTDCLFVRFLF